MRSGDKNDDRRGEERQLERFVEGFTEWVMHGGGEGDHKKGDKKSSARRCQKTWNSMCRSGGKKTKKKHAAVELLSEMFSRGKECSL